MQIKFYSNSPKEYKNNKIVSDRDYVSSQAHVV